MMGYLYLLKNYLLYLFLGLVVLSSCSYRNTSRLLKFPSTFKTDTLKTIIVANEKPSYEQYKIKPYDLISIRNLQDPALLGSRVGEQGSIDYNYKVNNEGDLILPVIGSVKVINLTREQAKEKIEKAYTQSLFKDPIIELKINSLKVTLLGAFNSQGNIILENEDYDLIDVIGRAGGISEDANIKTVRIIRGDRSNPELILVDLANVNTLSNSKLKLQDGDIIIAENNRTAVFFRNAQALTAISSLVFMMLNSYFIFKNINN